jgi:hypothetical protein
MPTTPTYAVGDLVTVISDKPTYRIGRTHLPSKATKGDLFRVSDVWDDGDLTLQTPEGERTGYVVSPQHVEPYIAPAITAPFAVYDLTGYEQAIRNGWGSIVDTLWSIPTEEPEPDDLDRRADALEMALDILGDDRLVDDYVLAARFILGEEA